MVKQLVISLMYSALYEAVPVPPVISVYLDYPCNLLVWEGLHLWNESMRGGLNLLVTANLLQTWCKSCLWVKQDC
jgi:hypothetical protein